MTTLDAHAPQKKKVLRANQKPYVTKRMRKAIMLRSQLENKFFSEGTNMYWNALKKQSNYCTRLYKRERKKYYSNLDIKNITDNKKFWKTVKPLFGDKGGMGEKIVLVENDKIISDDKEVAETFNTFFKNAVTSLGIGENKLLLNHNSCSQGNEGSVDKIIQMFETHPSIILIKKHVKVESEFSFTTTTPENIKEEILKLNTKKASTNIPTKQFKQACDVICEPLSKIWNEEVIGNRIYPGKLKLADISPIFKSLENTLVKNYRPVSVLPIVSKIFERIMDKQTDAYMDSKLSKYVCGYRKGYSCQYALLAMIEVEKVL